MKIIYRTSDGVVLYARGDLTLAADGARGGDWHDATTTTANASIATVASLPAKWVGGGYSYANGAFSVHSQVTIDAAFPAAVPQEVTMRQARQQLRIDGKLGQVNAALQGMTGLEGELARDEWEYSTVVQRNRPLVLQLGSQLGLNLDELFTKAAKL